MDEDKHEVNATVPRFNILELVAIAYNGHKSIVSPLVIRLVGPMPYESGRVIPYKYNATMLEDGKEVHIPSFSSVVNITDVIGVTQSGRVFAAATPKRTKDVMVGKPTQAITHVMQSGQSSGVDQNSDKDEVLKLIKRSDFNMVGQLLHTPSKIFVLYLLINSKAHREALEKVLEQAYVDHDVTIGQFDSIVANITTCNNLSFSTEEFPEQGRNHNLALHISMNCQEDAMSNMLMDTGSSLNVTPMSTMSKLSHQGAPMRFSGVVMKVFDGSRKTVIGEVDLPIKIGPCLFQITFQVMDIHPTYNCLLGRPWIHKVGAVTSPLRQKLKFMKNGKLVVMGGEQVMLVSHLSSFSYIDVDEVVGTPFQALSVDDNVVKKNGASMTSLKDAQQVVNGKSSRWGQVVELAKNKNIVGLGFSPSSTRRDLKQIKGIFHSVGFIHSKDQSVSAILKDDEEQEASSFVTHGLIYQNWPAVDVPFVVHMSK
ncbi:uncharacterized protein LOC127122761 [Lathyrus oleraceus]|uniref:uncharacterized protein LOC127122761 n=1 Tax=Pisum sativum TaxID=3888 RepID=UPI0021D1E590|nr:uncharacterized protein LOC127122761 [Pisum sativum]